MVGEIEKHHEERYRALLHNVEMQEVFAKSEVKFGNVVIVDILLLVKKHLKFVQYVITHKLILK